MIIHTMKVIRINRRIALKSTPKPPDARDKSPVEKVIIQKNSFPLYRILFPPENGLVPSTDSAARNLI